MNGSSKVSGFLLRIVFASKDRMPIGISIFANYRRTPIPPGGGGKLIREMYSKVAVHRTATSFDYSRLKTLSLQVTTHQTQAGERTAQQHRSRTTIRDAWPAELPDRRDAAETERTRAR